MPPTSIIDSVIRNVLLESNTLTGDGRQLTLIADDLFNSVLEAAWKKAENLRIIFAHESIDPELINLSDGLQCEQLFCEFVI